MKLKDVHQDAQAWARKAKHEIDSLMNTEINELNPACLARILSIVTGFSAGATANRLMIAGRNTSTIENQLKEFYNNI